MARTLRTRSKDGAFSAECADATALVSPENVARQARAARKGASTRRVDEMPGNVDTENRRSEVAACS